MDTKIRLQLLKKTAIFLILLSTILVSFSTIAVADKNFQIKMYSKVDVTWNINESQKPIIPRDEVKTLKLAVSYTVDTGDYIADGMYDVWKVSNSTNEEKNPVIKIKLIITSTSSWCSAALKSNIVFVNFSKNQTTTATLYITLDEDAPAYGSGHINIDASIGSISGTPLKPYKNSFNLSFIPKFRPYVRINLLDDINTLEVNPMQQAVFPIDVENLGNARTKVFLEVVNLPDKWIGVVTNELTLEKKNGSIKTAYLSVQAPKNFGYHDEQQIIQVALTPTRAENISDRGDTIYTTFLIKSKGIATPGFETELFIFLFILIGILLYINKIKRKSSN